MRFPLTLTEVTAIWENAKQDDPALYRLMLDFFELGRRAGVEIQAPPRDGYFAVKTA